MSSATINPFRNAEQWDVLECGGDVSPGMCKLSGFSRASGWEKKKGKGAKGTTLTLNEFPPCSGTVTFYLWLEEHFVAWGTFRGRFMYDPTKKPATAVDVYHPSLADIDCLKVVCEDIGAIEPVGQGMYKITVKLCEFHPPPKKSAVSTPKTSADKSGSKAGGSGDPVADAQQEEIKRLLAEARKP